MNQQPAWPVEEIVWVGIDNGSTGSLAFMCKKKYLTFSVPKKKVRHYTKKEKYVHRIDMPALSNMLISRCIEVSGGKDIKNCQVRMILEQPFTGASSNAFLGQRAFEATLIAIETSGFLPPVIVYSKTWQRVLLGKVKSKETKIRSKIVGEKLYPGSAVGSDCDAILLAHWLKITTEMIK